MIKLRQKKWKTNLTLFDKNKDQKSTLTLKEHATQDLATNLY